MNSFKLKDYSYTLPKEQIAQFSISPRDHSKLMVLDLNEKKLRHSNFFNIELLLRSGDVLVVNTSKVLPARLFGKKETGGKVEIFLVRKEKTNAWTALLKNIKSADAKKRIIISRNLTAYPKAKHADGTWLIEFSVGGAKLNELIFLLGKTPIPPYVQKKTELADYQTVYAKTLGSVAAPTAGFHFTKQLLARLKKKGVQICSVTLHVGPGTFSPLRNEDIRNHVMHPEFASVSKAAARMLNQAKKEKRRIIAVGTTSVRVLEGFSSVEGVIEPGKKDINLYLFPGVQFKMVDAMITNFHLPQSTLLVLVTAFAEWKKKGSGPRILRAYKDALKKGYRFYSFGDAMFIQ